MSIFFELFKFIVSIKHLILIKKVKTVSLFYSVKTHKNSKFFNKLKMLEHIVN